MIDKAQQGIFIRQRITLQQHPIPETAWLAALRLAPGYLVISQGSGTPGKAWSMIPTGQELICAFLKSSHRRSFIPSTNRRDTQRVIAQNQACRRVKLVS